MRFHKLDLNLLPVLDVMLELGTVQATADSLRLTQPAISGALQRLRDHFEDPLFIPQGRKLVPTAFALSLHPATKRMLAEAHSLAVARPRFDPATSSRCFSFMATDHEVVTLLIPLVRRLERIAPQVTVEISPAIHTSEAAFDRYEIDFVIRPDEGLDSRWPSETLFTDTLVCIAARDNLRLRGQESITTREFLDLKHAVVRPGSQIKGRSEVFFEKNDVHRRIGIYVCDPLMMAEIVSSSQMIGLMQKRLAMELAERMKLVIFQPPLPTPLLSVSVQWRHGQRYDPGTVWMLQMLHQEVNR